MIYTDDELLMIRALELLKDNRHEVQRVESTVYMQDYYDYTIDLLKQRLYKEDK